MLVLAPKSVQEAADLTYLAFDLADKWRMPAMILGDGLIGQMMESIILPEYKEPALLPVKSEWSVGHMNQTHRKPHRITSIILDPEELERKIRSRYERYKKIETEEIRFEEKNCEEADVILIAYGTAARVCQSAQQSAAGQGIKAGLFRPITLWPFPYAQLEQISQKGKPILVVEMSMGQMIEDVQLSVHDKVPVNLLSHAGGVIPTEEEVFERLRSIVFGGTK